LPRPTPHIFGATAANSAVFRVRNVPCDGPSHFGEAKKSTRMDNLDV
jgi:hypothetical protein